MGTSGCAIAASLPGGKKCNFRFGVCFMGIRFVGSYFSFISICSKN